MPWPGCTLKHRIVTWVQGCAYQSNNITLIECRDDLKLVTIVFNDLKWKCIKYSYIVTIISDTVYIVACISSRNTTPPSSNPLGKQQLGSQLHLLHILGSIWWRYNSVLYI